MVNIVTATADYYNIIINMINLSYNMSSIDLNGLVR